MKTSTRQWLEFAKADLINCERILNEEFLTSIIAFHTQQAVEKCFKALIEENNLTIPRIHSLIRLHSVIEGLLDQPINTRELLAFDSVYINSRYPTDIGLMPTGKPTLKDAQEFYESAKQIFDQISKLID